MSMSRHCSDPSLLKLAGTIDDSYRHVVQALREDKNIKHINIAHPARIYKNIWERLSLLETNNGTLIVLDGHRIIPPLEARQNLLTSLHSGHPGINKMCTWAKQLYFWPGMANEIEVYIQSCQACSKFRPAQQRTKGEAFLPSQTGGPLSHLGIDYFTYAGKPWVAVADRFSGYIWTKKMPSENTSTLIGWLLKMFNHYGWPLSIRSDGGPQFRSDFSSFCKKYHIIHETSSAYNPSSNGLAESAVKSIKNLLKRCTETRSDFNESLAAFLQTPRADGFSPFQLFFGRQGRLPQLPSIIRDTNLQAGIKSRDNARISQQKQIPAKRYAPLRPGDAVIFPDQQGNWTRSGVIKSARPSTLSYDVEHNGRTYSRSRALLRRPPIPAKKFLTDNPSSGSGTVTPPQSSSRPSLRRSPRLLKT